MPILFASLLVAVFAKLPAVSTTPCVMLLNTLLAAATLLPTHTAALPAATPTEPKAPPRRPEAGIAAAVTVAPPTPATVAAVPAVPNIALPIPGNINIIAN